MSELGVELGTGKRILALAITAILATSVVNGQTASGRSTRFSFTAPSDTVSNSGKNTNGNSKFPMLTVRLSFAEASGNGILEAEETGTLKLVVMNQGMVPAHRLTLKVVPLTEASGLVVGRVPVVEELGGGESVVMDLPITATDIVGSIQNRLRLEILEEKGFDLDPPAIFAFQTQAFMPPVLVVADHKIADPNGTGRIEPGEIIEVTARIQNRGHSIAKGVRVDVSLGENVSFEEGSQRQFMLGDLRSGEWKDIKFSCYANNRATSMPIYFAMKEAHGEDTTRVLSLELHKPQKQQLEFIANAKESRSAAIPAAPGLSVDVDVDIPSSKSKNPDAVAIVIGISKYKNSNVPRVDFANHDAAVMRDYLVKEMGFSEERILYAVDEDAGRNDFNILFKKLSNCVRAGKSDVFVYYSGHGAPDTKTNEAFLVPFDCDPEYASVSGYPVSEFYSQISRLPARSVTVVLDACFSGSSPHGSLFKGVSPALLKVKNPITAMQNGVVFSSSSENQLSNWYPEKQHGLFTYFFLKGLQGAADANGNNQITVEELAKYLEDNIPDIAREQNHEQTPQVVGDTRAIIANYQSR